MSLDALRGFDMFWIVGAAEVVHALHKTGNDTVTGFLSTQVSHVQWVGFHFYDMIFPLFVFIAGVSMVFSMDKTVARHGRLGAWLRFGRRCAATCLATVVMIGIWGSVQWLPLWADQLTGGSNPMAKANVQMLVGLGGHRGLFRCAGNQFLLRAAPDVFYFVRRFAVVVRLDVPVGHGVWDALFVCDLPRQRRHFGFLWFVSVVLSRTVSDARACNGTRVELQHRASACCRRSCAAGQSGGGI